MNLWNFGVKAQDKKCGWKEPRELINEELGKTGQLTCRYWASKSKGR